MNEKKRENQGLEGPVSALPNLFEHLLPHLGKIKRSRSIISKHFNKSTSSMETLA